MSLIVTTRLVWRCDEGVRQWYDDELACKRRFYTIVGTAS